MMSKPTSVAFKREHFLSKNLRFQDKGSCSMLLAINIYHYVCPKQVLGLAWFPKTAMGASGSKKRVEAFHCIEHASTSSESDKPEAYCKNGDWESNRYLTFLCECDPGYTPNRENTMCLRKYFRFFFDSMNCMLPFRPLLSTSKFIFVSSKG